MLQILNKILPRLEKCLIVAFFILCTISAYKTFHRTNPVQSPIVQLQPTKTVIIAGKEHEQSKEVVISKDEMKTQTASIKKELKATTVKSVTTLVDHNSITLKDDTISIKRYDTRRWFLAPLEHKIDVTHTDTSIHSTMASSVSYKEPKVLFTIGPYVGYDPFSRKPSIGIGVTFNVISIKSRR